MATQVKTGLIANDAITDAKIANVALTGVTASSGDSSTSLATTAFVATEINSLIDSAPGALNTLNELAAAMGDDANFSTTVTNNIAAKAPLASPAFTGTPVIGTSTAGALEVGSANSFQIQKSGVNAFINQSDSGPIIVRMGSGFAEKMRLDASGKLGIGTSAPLSHLHVNKDTSGHNTDGITLGKVEANGWIDTNEEMGRLGWAASYGSSFTPAIGAYISAKADANWNGNEAPTRLGFFTAPENSLTPAEAMRIDSSQNVMIGGTNSRPAEFNHPKGISFRGDIGQIQASTDANTAMLLNRDTSDGTIAEFRKDGSTVGVIGTENWGIGTSSPNTTLTLSDGTDEFDFGVTANLLMIKSVTTDGSDDQRIIIDAGNGGLSSTRGAYVALSGNEASAHPGQAVYQMGNVTGSSHLFRKAGGVDAVIIDSDGKVGIGTSSPQALFDVTVPNVKTANAGVWGYLGKTNESSNYQALQCFQIGGNAADERRYEFQTIEQGLSNDGIIVLQKSGGRVFVGHDSADGNNDKVSIAGSIGISNDGYIGAGSGFGPSNTAGSSSTIQLYSSSTGNMTFAVNYSAADAVFNMGGASKFVVKRSAAGTEAIQLYTQDGGVRIGALNSGYHHTQRLSGPSKYYWDNRCEASGGFHTYSDEKLKKEVSTITGALDKVAVMNGVTFKWKDAENRGSGDTGKQFGVLAQNMLEVDSDLPSLNIDPLAEAGNEETSEKYYSMDYSRITPFLIEAVKELKTKLEAAEARIATLEG